MKNISLFGRISSIDDVLSRVSQLENQLKELESEEMVSRENSHLRGRFVKRCHELEKQVDDQKRRVENIRVKEGSENNKMAVLLKLDNLQSRISSLVLERDQVSGASSSGHTRETSSVQDETEGEAMSTIYPGSQLQTVEGYWVIEERPETRTRPPPKLPSASNSQLLKLLLLMLVTIVIVLYRHRFNHSFRAYEQLANRVEESGAASNNNDLLAVRFVLRILVDYKELLWTMSFAMFFSIVTSAILLIKLKYGKSQKQAKRVVCVVDALTLMVLSYLFTTRFYIAENLELHLQEALGGANRLIDTNDFNNELNCSIVPRENLPSCANAILIQRGPDMTLEYVVLPCWLAVSYILVSYPIHYCLHQFCSQARRDRSVTDDIHTQHTQSMALSSVHES